MDSPVTHHTINRQSKMRAAVVQWILQLPTTLSTDNLRWGQQLYNGFPSYPPHYQKTIQVDGSSCTMDSPVTHLTIKRQSKSRAAVVQVKLDFIHQVREWSLVFALLCLLNGKRQAAMRGSGNVAFNQVQQVFWRGKYGHLYMMVKSLMISVGALDLHFQFSYIQHGLA